MDIANDPEEYSRGLMFKKSLEWNNGMLFVFEDERTRSFWMKNTLIPLDIIFIDSNLTIVDIKENAQPCIENDNGPCQTYVSDHPAKFVLEVNAGFVQRNDVGVGDHVSIDDSNNQVLENHQLGGNEPFDDSANAVAAARSFLLAKLPELGIHISSELDLHTGMVVVVETESKNIVLNFLSWIRKADRMIDMLKLQMVK